MTWFNALQLALGLCAIVMIVKRLRTLCLQAPLDNRAFCEALDLALAAEQMALAKRIAAANEPAWPARLASLALGRADDPRAASALVEDTLAQYEQAATDGLRAIVTLGRMASPLAFIGVVLEIGRAYGGGSGIEALQRGAVLSSALERSVLTFALGMSTLVFCAASLGILRRRARALTRDLHRVTRVLARDASLDRSEM